MDLSHHKLNDLHGRICVDDEWFAEILEKVDTETMLKFEWFLDSILLEKAPQKPPQVAQRWLRDRSEIAQRSLGDR